MSESFYLESPSPPLCFEVRTLVDALGWTPSDVTRVFVVQAVPQRIAQSIRETGCEAMTLEQIQKRVAAMSMQGPLQPRPPASVSSNSAGINTASQQIKQETPRLFCTYFACK